MVRRSDLPTVPPPFDPDQFAKDSDARVTIIAPAAVPSETGETAGRDRRRSERRLITRPTMAAAVTDEAWARTKTGTLVLTARPDALKRMPLDHRAGFLLSWMDGTVDLDTLIEVSTIGREEVLRLVRDLFDSGVVDFR